MRLHLYFKKNLSNDIKISLKRWGEKRRKTVLQRPYFVKDTCVYIQDYKRPLERLGTVCMEAEAARLLVVPWIAAAVCVALGSTEDA